MRHKINITSWWQTAFNVESHASNKFFNGFKQNIVNFGQNHPQLGGGIVISAIILFLITFGYLLALTPPQWGKTTKQVVEIRFGSSLRDVASKLDKSGIIRNQKAFEVYVRLKPRQRMVKAGRYLLSPGMSVPQIVKELRRGLPQMIRVTIPEGLTNKEIATLLAAKGLVNRDRFLERLADQDFVNSLLKEKPLHASAEGYLFPDTYEFDLNSSESLIITTFLNRFNEIFATYFKQIPASKRKEVVIMASLIEKEAQKEAERSIISGVFYNRLRLHYPLQSCATVQYALGTRKEKLSFKDLEVNSPYNTYQHSGLPPGPIANPGLASLKAAAFPVKVSYLYFVAKPDGSHFFSNTFQEHLNAQRRIERLGRF